MANGKLLEVNMSAPSSPPPGSQLSDPGVFAGATAAPGHVSPAPTDPPRPAAPEIDPADLLRRYERSLRYYSNELIRLIRLHVPPGSRVLEVGVRQAGDLLAALAPARGVGIEPGAGLIDFARRRHPQLDFRVADPLDFDLQGETFDFIVVSTTLADVPDVQRVFAAIRRACASHTRVVVAYHNAAWEPLLKLATWLGLRRPVGEQNWLSVQDLTNLMHLADLEPVRRSAEVLMPLPVPLLAPLLNRLIGRIWPFTHLGLIQVLIARAQGAPPSLANPKVTVVVPTRNERGNILGAVTRTPEMGAGTEIIFVDGNSTDGTADEIRAQIAAHPQRDMKLILQGDGIGKGDAVRKGFSAATGDILMILDADLTVPPEMLPRFVEALRGGKGEFINGTRLVYPMEKDAMRFLNKLGNRFFSAVFTWLLGQPIRDTLCGTKVLSKRNYEIIAANRHYFGDFDPFGDFDLLLGAAKANLKIIEVPIRYEARRYGTTNISRFKHGWLLLRMSAFAFVRLKLR